MKTISLTLFVFIAIHLYPAAPMAGEVDNATPPASTSSHTLEDVWNRLDNGEPGSPEAPAEPSAFPSTGTGKTINNIMDIAPAQDNINGAAPDDVIRGVEFWGLRGGEWGLQTGVLIPTPVPKTGQTTFYATGDDGDLETGVAWPNPRFTDNGNGTVSDNLTGLIWLKNANCFGSRNWTTALNDCNTLASGSCGLTDGSMTGDWRLPNVVELQSLANYEFYAPAVPNTAGTGQWTEGNPFNTVQSSGYWSGSTRANYPSYAWYVYMDNGNADALNKTDTYYVWPVRVGQDALGL